MNTLPEGYEERVNCALDQLKEGMGILVVAFGDDEHPEKEPLMIREMRQVVRLLECRITTVLTEYKQEIRT